MKSYFRLPFLLLLAGLSTAIYQSTTSDDDGIIAARRGLKGVEEKHSARGIALNYPRAILELPERSVNGYSAMDPAYKHPRRVKKRSPSGKTPTKFVARSPTNPAAPPAVPAGKPLSGCGNTGKHGKRTLDCPHYEATVDVANQFDQAYKTLKNMRNKVADYKKIKNHDRNKLEELEGIMRSSEDQARHYMEVYIDKYGMAVAANGFRRMGLPEEIIRQIGEHHKDLPFLQNVRLD